MNQIIKTFADNTLAKSVNETDMTVVGIISSKALDRDGDSILPNGIDDTNYSKNPIVLFNHNYNQPIGKSLWRKVDGGNYLSKTQFGNTTLAKEIFSLMKDGILNAFSVGFMPTEEPTFEKEVRVFGKIELLEYSVVSVPANPAAITLSFVKSLQSPELISTYFKDYIVESIQNDVAELKEWQIKQNSMVDEQLRINAMVKEIVDERSKSVNKNNISVKIDDIKRIVEEKLKIKL